MKASRKESDRGGPSQFDDLAIRRLEGKGSVSLPSLVSDLSKDSGYNADKVTEGLMKLQSKKLIVISEKSPFSSLSSYAASPRSSWFWAALAAMLLSLAFIFATSGPALYLRYAFGTVLILFLPGYSLIEMLYPKKDLDELARFALSIGLSLAVVPLVGLVLNYTPLGVRLWPVALSISGLTLVFLVVALTRKHSYYKVENGLS